MSSSTNQNTTTNNNNNKSGSSFSLSQTDNDEINNQQQTNESDQIVWSAPTRLNSIRTAAVNAAHLAVSSLQNILSNSITNNTSMMEGSLSAIAENTHNNNNNNHHHHHQSVLHSTGEY